MWYKCFFKKILVASIPSNSGGYEFVFYLKLADYARENSPAPLNSFTEKQVSFFRK